MNSLEAKIGSFQSSFQNLSNTSLSSDLLKGIVDTGTAALDILNELIDNFGILSTLLGVGSGIFSQKTGLGKI
jgi:hypothetical protein